MTSSAQKFISKLATLVKTVKTVYYLRLNKFLPLFLELPLPDSTNVFHAMDKSLGDGQLEFVLRRKTHHELHEAEKLQRQKKSKLYGAQTATVSGMTIPPSLLSPSPGKAQVKVERKESVAQKIGSVSMANLGKVFVDSRG